MSVMATRYEDLPVRPDGFTIDDLASMPDDGRRYELIDGVLIVSPAPRWEHQVAVDEITARLRGAAPADVHVFGASPDVTAGRRTSVQPDVCVVPLADLVPDESYQGVPLLAVEVLSPCTAGVDQLLKRRVYASLGVPSYWIVDVANSSITVLELVDGGYIERTTVHGDACLAVEVPFPVTLRPSDVRIA